MIYSSDVLYSATEVVTIVKLVMSGYNALQSELNFSKILSVVSSNDRLISGLVKFA